MKAHDYLDIWNVENPAYGDASQAGMMVKGISLLTVNFLTAFLFLAVFQDLRATLVFLAFTTALFIAAFHDNFFKLRHLFSFHFKRVARLRPFADFHFWMDRADDLKTIYFTNKKDLRNVALKVFSVSVIPENIRPTISLFIKTLNRKRISYTYQVVFTPLVESGGSKELDERLTCEGSEGSFLARIHFLVASAVDGILTTRRLRDMNKELGLVSKVLRASFYANFHHFQVKELRSNALVNALRTHVLQEDTDVIKEKSYAVNKQGLAGALVKLSCLTFLFTLLTYFLLELNVPLFSVVILEGALLLTLISLWWRGVPFLLTKIKVHRNEKAHVIDPFQKMDFYRYSALPDSLFMHYDEKYLFNFKLFSLAQCMNHTHVFPDKLFRSTMALQMPLDAL